MTHPGSESDPPRRQGMRPGSDRVPVMVPRRLGSLVGWLGHQGGVASDKFAFAVTFALKGEADGVVLEAVEGG